MQTITLKVEDSVSEKFMWLLNHFSKNEIEIIENKQELDITPINSDDEDYKYILKGRVERKKHPENYGTMDDIDWN